jgi:tRNA threonylcarbamoyladenosine biosynthesis protein TsaB
MLLLATDTSGKSGSIALVECGPGDQYRTLEVVALTGGTFSAQLVPQIAALLEKHQLTKHEIGAFAVAAGPGSFTGLRVGLAAIKALAEVLGKPIVAVSLLEVVAESASAEGKVFGVLDAGRNEVYVGEYEFKNSQARLISEKLMSREQCFEAAVRATIVTPDESVASAAQALGLAVARVEHPRSDAIARIGWRKLQAGQIVSPEALEANYIRRSDAEIFANRSS